MYRIDGNVYIEHIDVLSLLSQQIGQMLVRNLVPADTFCDYYKVLGEFELSKFGRIDSVIELFPDSTRLGIEIKCRSGDLMDDHKTFERYLKSGVCDYYYIVTVNEEMALLACLKFKNTPIGIACLSSGRVMKSADKQIKTKAGERLYKETLLSRSLLPNNDEFIGYYLHDNDIVNLNDKGNEIVKNRRSRKS